MIFACSTLGLEQNKTFINQDGFSFVPRTRNYNDFSLESSHMAKFRVVKIHYYKLWSAPAPLYGDFGRLKFGVSNLPYRPTNWCPRIENPQKLCEQMSQLSSSHDVNLSVFCNERPNARCRWYHYRWKKKIITLKTHPWLRF